MTRIRVATYNVHSCVGADGLYDPVRIGHVLEEIGADIIGLQEIDTSPFSIRPSLSDIPLRPNRRKQDKWSKADDVALLRDDAEKIVFKEVASPKHQLDYLVHSTGYPAIEGLLMKKRSGLFGNALLTAYPIKEVRRIDLTIPGGRQTRGAIDADLDIHGTRLRVIVAHLGLQLHERYFQIRRLLRALGPDRDQRILMMGDFNIWSSMFPKMRQMYRRLGHVPLVTTFPSLYPILPLDRIWTQPADSIKNIKAHASHRSRLASDHLPLVATIQI